MSMKNRIGILMALVVVAIAAVTLYIALRSYGGRLFAELVVSEDVAESIKEARREDTGMEVGIFFNGQELFSEKEAGRIYYSIVDGDDAPYDPVVAVKGGKNAQIVFAGRIDEEMIRNNKSVSCVVYDDDRYCVLELVCTYLPIMNINCESEISDLESVMDLWLYDNRSGCEEPVTKSQGLIRFRGGNTKEFPKKPLKISFTYKTRWKGNRNKDVSLLGMRKDDDYILYPAYNDSDKVRNVFSQNLWYESCNYNNENKVTTGIEYKYLELFLNGEYYGLYALGYTPDPKMVQADKADVSQGFYKRVVGIETSKLFYGDYGNLYGWRIENNPSKDDSGYYTQKRWDLMTRYLTYLQDNAGEKETLKSCIDIDNAIDYYIFINLVQGDDNQYKNYYLYIKDKAEKGYYSLYCPWDLDVTWGNMWVPNAHNGYVQYGHKPYYNLMFEDSYFGQVMADGDSDIVNRIADRYQELRSWAWSDETINSMLDEYEKEIFASGAYLRDKENWPDGDYQEDCQNNLSRFREYVMERLSEADNYFERVRDCAEEDIFIQRAAQYKYFDDSDFVIEINNHDALSDPANQKLLEKIGGIDISRIDTDVRYVVKVKGEGTYYLQDYEGDVSPAQEEVVILFGDHELSLHEGDERDYEYDDTGYTVYLDGVAFYDTFTDHQEPMIISLAYDGFGEQMNLQRRYVLNE